jgi:hypothetical protein
VQSTEAPADPPQAEDRLGIFGHERFRHSASRSPWG